MDQDFNNWENSEIKKEIEADWIAWRKTKLYMVFVKDKGTFVEALENIQLHKIDYAGLLWLSMQSGDAKDFLCYAREAFIEYCQDQAQIIAERDADGMTERQMRADLHGVHKETLDDMLEQVHSTIRVELVENV